MNGPSNGRGRSTFGGTTRNKTGIVAGSVPIAALAPVTGPTALGNATNALGPVIALSVPEILSLIFERGADLGNADVTVQPFTTRTSLVVMPAGTMTANRAVTLGNTGFYATAGMFTWYGILRLDTSAFTLRVNRADGTQIYLDPASPAASRLLVFACDNAGAWISSQYIFHVRD